MRDAAWATLTRADARRHVAFWTDVVRRCPDAHVAAPGRRAGLRRLAAGQGRWRGARSTGAARAIPDYRLAGLLADSLAGALPPSAWDAVLDGSDAGLPPERR